MSESFSFLLLTVSAQQREEPACGRIPPPPPPACLGLSNYPWTRLSLRIIGAIKRQFFSHGNACFDNSNLSQEIFAIDNRHLGSCNKK